MTRPELYMFMLSIEAILETTDDKVKAADTVLQMVKKVIAETSKSGK